MKLFYLAIFSYFSYLPAHFQVVSSQNFDHNTAECMLGVRSPKLLKLVGGLNFDQYDYFLKLTFYNSDSYTVSKCFKFESYEDLSLLSLSLPEGSVALSEVFRSSKMLN